MLVILLVPAWPMPMPDPVRVLAVLSSFWAISVAFLYSFYALMTWPFRQLSG